jgi:hypothetical protein
MTLRVVGAGLGRTGTSSLKTALELLLGAPCYHMSEVFAHPEHSEVWTGAFKGSPPDWKKFFSGYAAEVDWPGAPFWHEIAAVFPKAIILLSTRDSAETWWNSANETIFRGMGMAPPSPWKDMATAMFSNFADPSNKRAAMAAYEKHNADVRARAPKSRLVEYQPGDGWEPLCKALGVPVPNEPFPHTNTREEFLERIRSQRPPT